MIYTKLCSIEFEIQRVNRQINARIDTLKKKIFELVRKSPQSEEMEEMPMLVADLPVSNDEELLGLNEKIKNNENNMRELVNHQNILILHLT